MGMLAPVWSLSVLIQRVLPILLSVFFVTRELVFGRQACDAAPHATPLPPNSFTTITASSATAAPQGSVPALHTMFEFPPEIKRLIINVRRATRPLALLRAPHPAPPSRAPPPRPLSPLPRWVHGCAYPRCLVPAPRCLTRPKRKPRNPLTFYPD